MIDILLIYLNLLEISEWAGKSSDVVESFPVSLESRASVAKWKIYTHLP